MFLKLVATLIRNAMAKAAANKGAIGLAVGTSLVADSINMDWLLQESARVAPGSEQAGIIQAAQTAARMLGLGGEEVLWPTHQRGPNAGEFITPRYFTLDLVQGRAWYSGKHYSRKAVNAAFMRGRKRPQYVRRGPVVGR